MCETSPNAHDLLLLTLELEQLGDEQAMRARFVERLDALFPGCAAALAAAPSAQGTAFEVATRRRRFGYLAVQGLEPDDARRSLLAHAAALLALALERRAQARLLAENHDGREPAASRDPQEFAESHPRLLSLFEKNAGGMVLLGRDGRISRVNAAARATLGLDESALLGRSLFDPRWEAVWEDGTPAARDDHPAMRTLLTGEPAHNVVLGIRSNVGGERKWLLLSTEALRADDGSVEEVLATFFDISERKLLEERIGTKQKLESLGLLAAGLAHDFNNLLAAILGNATLAAQEMPQEAPTQEPLQQIVEAARRAADLTRQLLAYAGKASLFSERLSIAQTVRDTGALLAASVSKNCRLEYELDERARIEGDPKQLQQVLLNLTINASEAIGASEGHVRIRCGLCERSREQLEALVPEASPAAGTYAFLEVEDDGEGMNEQTRARLFEPFFTTRFLGRGLGMAAVLGIARAHRGAVEVDSEPGRGARIRFLVPARSEQAAPPPQPRRREGAVLVVDDETIVRTLARRILERAGYRVLVAESGAHAVELFKEQGAQIQLALLDLTMPKMDGFATLRALRELDDSLPVLLSSGHSEEGLLDRCQAERVTGFVQKPYSIDELRLAVEGAIGKASPENRASAQP